MSQLSDPADLAMLAARPIAPREIAALVADGLTEVERLFRENLDSPIEIVDEIGRFVVEGGGKRVRPTLHLLVSRMCGYRGNHDVVVATALEYIHCATLIHDDLIDDAPTRRGRVAAHVEWGNTVSVLFGDYLLAKAMQLAVRAGSLEVMDKIAEVTLRMTEGEMMQTRYEGQVDLTVDQYFGLIERKTAVLFRCCCELAGVLAGVDDDAKQALGRYGLNLGLEFQVVDDLLDLTGETQRLGKPVASDLAEGKPTLAVIELLREAGSRERELVERIMTGQGSETEIRALGRAIVESGAIERTRDVARRLADRATHELSRFPDGAAKQALLALPETLLHRDR